MANDTNSDNKDTVQTESVEDSGTIFDDVFRTIIQKMPSLLIPLINEVFGTKYSEDQEVDQLRNEHYEKFGKIITDSLIRICGHLYHLECQSEKDGDMALRMAEYDFAVALEHASKMENGIIEINFPDSCVLYIRNHRGMPNYHEARVRFADGQVISYKVPIIKAQDYTVHEIFEKQLLVLLPYHILRYESFLKSGSDNQKKIKKLLSDYDEINQKLNQKMQEKEAKKQLYFDLIKLINQIADYVIPEGSQIRERIGAMGGKVLQLESERLLQEGRNKEKFDVAVRMWKANMSVENIAIFIDDTVENTVTLLEKSGFAK